MTKLLQPYKTESALAVDMTRDAGVVGLSLPELQKPAGVLVIDAREYGMGAFGLRVLLESHLEALLDGAILAGFATGASQAYLFVSGRYPQIWRNLQTILADRREIGLLGGKIFGTRFKFDMEARLDVMGEGNGSLLISQLAGQLVDQNDRLQEDQITILSAWKTVALAQAWCEITDDSVPLFPNSALVAVSGVVGKKGLFETEPGATLIELLTQAEADDFRAVQVGGIDGRLLAAEAICDPQLKPFTSGLNSLTVYPNGFPMAALLGAVMDCLERDKANPEPFRQAIRPLVNTHPNQTGNQPFSAGELADRFETLAIAYPGQAQTLTFCRSIVTQFGEDF